MGNVMIGFNFDFVHKYLGMLWPPLNTLHWNLNVSGFSFKFFPKWPKLRTRERRAEQRTDIISWADVPKLRSFPSNWSHWLIQLSTYKSFSGKDQFTLSFSASATESNLLLAMWCFCSVIVGRGCRWWWWESVKSENLVVILTVVASRLL